MEDIYNILSKHFQENVTKEEQNQIDSFIKANPKEYETLKKVWNTKSVQITDFNTPKAWDTIQPKLKKETKIIPLYKRIGRIAAAAAIFTFIALSGYYTIEFVQQPNILLAHANVSEKGKTIVLSDGSKVWLNTGATLSFPEEFDDNFRNVTLTGEAFFEVEKNPEKPFIVNMDNASVTVLGTSFNISSSTEKTEVTVATGKVKVATGLEYVFITKGYSASVSPQQVIKHQTKDMNYLSWKTGEFVFNDLDMFQVIADLNTYYPNGITISDNWENHCSLTAHFKQAKLQEVLEIIGLTCDLELTLEKEITDN
jgi:ferric-dicitrate binding protein FerR (iron transport regulator)